MSGPPSLESGQIENLHWLDETLSARFSKLFMSMLATEFAKQEAEDLKSLVEDQVCRLAIWLKGESETE